MIGGTVLVTMKITGKVEEEVIGEVVGAEVIPLVKALKNKKNVSEFKLAENLKQEVNITRNMLYRLYDANLVTFIGKKDKVKGWYIYYWTFNPHHIKYLGKDLKKKRLERLKERLKREKSSDFFICANKCIRLDFDQATEFNYKCAECGSLLHQEDNTQRIMEIEKELGQLQKEMKKN